MMKDESILPAKFTMDAYGRLYNVQWMPDENRYHIWRGTQSYQDALAYNNYGRWRMKDVLRTIQDGDWKIVLDRNDYADEEDISIDSLEGIL